LILDGLMVAAYFGAMLLVGWRSKRQSAESYWVAERRSPSGLVAASLIATVFGASSTMGIIGLGYSRGLTGAWWSLIGAMALIPFGWFLAARVRALEVFTLPDILERAYGRRVSVPAAVMIATAWCGIVAAQMIAGALLLSGIFTLGFQSAVAFVAVVFIVYTFLGGQLSVIRTDLWQLLLFLSGLMVCLALLLSSESLDWTRLSGDHLSFPVSASFSWYDLLVFYPLIIGLPYLVGPDIYSRMLCAKDDLAARRSVFLAVSVIIPVSFLLAATGLAIGARFPGLEAEAALPTALNGLVPVGLKGFIAAGFLAAIMSSADTTLVSASTIVSLNIISPIRKVSRDQQLRLTRMAVVVLGALAWLIAVTEQGIIASLLLGYTIFVGGVVFPTLASFGRGRLRATSAAALWAVVVGGATALLGNVRDGAVLKTLVTPAGESLLRRILGEQYAAILPVLLSFFVLVVVSQITRRDLVESREQANME
jgi:SSS family solute:Na+ symporter